MSEQDVREAHAEGESVAMARREHYHANIAGQGAQAGDPMSATSTAMQQSNPTAGQNPQATVNTKSTL